MADITIMNELEGQFQDEMNKIKNAGSNPNTGNKPVEREEDRVTGIEQVKVSSAKAQAGLAGQQASTATAPVYNVKRLPHAMSDDTDAYVCGVRVTNPSVESAMILAESISGNKHATDIYDFWLSSVDNKFKTRIDYELGDNEVRFFVKPIMPWDTNAFGCNTPYEAYNKAFMVLASVFVERRLPEVEALM